MGRLVRGIAACALCLWILNLSERHHIYLNTFGTIVLVTLFIYIVVFPGGKKAVDITSKTITQERIINLHDGSLGEIFISSQYPTYRKERSGTEGNDYISPTGGIICTKYVTTTENIPTVRSSAGRHFFCILLILITLAYWNQYILDDTFVQKVLPTKRSVSFDYTGYNIDEVERALKMHGWYVNISKECVGTEQIGVVLRQEIDVDNNQVTLYVSDGLYLDKTISRTGGHITPSVKTLSIKIGEVYNIYYACYGDLPDNIYLNGTAIPNVSATWGEWTDDGRATLTIEGISESKGYIRMFLYDSSNDELLAYTDVFVIVQ